MLTILNTCVDVTNLHDLITIEKELEKYYFTLQFDLHIAEVRSFEKEKTPFGDAFYQKVTRYFLWDKTNLVESIENKISVDEWIKLFNEYQNK